MRPPKGFEIVAKSLGLEYEEGDLLELHSCIYGLKESGREWFLEWTTELKAQGFEAIPAEPCVMTKTVKGELIEAIIFHVDTAGKKIRLTRNFWEKCKRNFHSKIWGDHRNFWGSILKLSRGECGFIWSRTSRSSWRGSTSPISLSHTLQLLQTG